MNAIMNDEKRKLVEEHAWLVRIVILSSIRPNESVPGLEHDDLYQTGCEALCHAALCYDESRGASFATFATKFVKNALISHCRRVMREREGLECLDAPLSADSPLTRADLLEDKKAGFADDNDWEICRLLRDAETKSSGVTRKGIVSLRLRCLGYSNADISKVCGARSNHVAAWISKASKYLRADQEFLQRLSA